MFTQTEVESRLSDAMPDGTREDIARETGIYPGIVRGWINPDDERKSPFFTVLQIMAALDRVRPAVGSRVWQEMCAMREASRPATMGQNVEIDLDGKMGDMAKEVTDVVVAKCMGKPTDEQLREIQEAEEAIAEYKTCVLEIARRRAVERVDNVRVM